MAVSIRNIITKLRLRGVVKIPQVVIEEQGLSVGSGISVSYGKNYTCIVLLPEGTKLNDRMQERIHILVNEPLG